MSGVMARRSTALSLSFQCGLARTCCIIQLDAIFMAHAHPARRAMLVRLGKGEATVGELGQPLDMSLPAVTKHLKVLERAKSAGTSSWGLR
jgi:hypothetical protein